MAGPNLCPLWFNSGGANSFIYVHFGLFPVKNNEENILKPLIYTKFKALRNITLGSFSFFNLRP